MFGSPMPKPVQDIINSCRRLDVQSTTDMTGRKDGVPGKKKRGPHKKGRKRSNTQVARDRALIAELHFKGGLSDYEIAAELNERVGIEYTLSRRPT